MYVHRSADSVPALCAFSCLIFQAASAKTSLEVNDAVWTCNLVYALQIDFMKRQGLLDKKFNRRRDEQSMYMEESCKFKHLTKRAGATAATAKA